jgi:hypothetical protein
VWLALVTGARRGELCAVRWRYLDLIGRVLVIRASIAQDGVDVWEKDAKLHQRRYISLDADTIAILMTYHHARQRRATVGATLTLEALTSRYRRLVRALGTAGVDLRIVAGRLGHAEGGTTFVYYAWVHQADHRASHILAARIPKPGARSPPSRTTRGDHPALTRPSPLNCAPPSVTAPSHLAPCCPPSSSSPPLTASRQALPIAPPLCSPMSGSSLSPAAAALSPLLPLDLCTGLLWEQGRMATCQGRVMRLRPMWVIKPKSGRSSTSGAPTL